MILRSACLIGLVCAGGAGCTARGATAEECRDILDRIVEVELREMGYADPELTALRQHELASRYAEELGECEGRAIPGNALACVARAESTEEISHECLR